MSSPVKKRKPAYPWTVPAAIGAVICLSLWGCLNFYQLTSMLNSSKKDPYGLLLQERRFRQVDTMLPQDAVVGYISDVPFGGVRGSAAFFGAQYVLAPRLVVELPARQKLEWVLGNFSEPGDYGGVAEAHQLAIVKDFGSGIVVFRKQGQ